MAYRFTPKDDSVQDAMRRITRQQVDSVLELIDAATRDDEVAVHELRKASKKLRALLRLVRPVFADFDKENQALRDIARSVSVLRDATILIGSFDRVVEAYGAQLDRQALGAVRARLTRRRNALVADTDVAGLLAKARTDLCALEKRSHDWTLDADGVDAVQRGLRRSYRRARHAMRDARATPTPDCMHEWRKRAKDHWYHARLFEPIWEEPMQAHANAAHALGDQLGDHHDLTVFLANLAARPEDFGDTTDAEVLAGLTRRLQAVLEAEAFAAGSRLFAESASSLAESWGKRYCTWREETPPHVEALRHAADDHG
jgi:CHAD domain-containing protein